MKEKFEIIVKNNKIGIMKVGDVDYISLTDLARYADEDDPRLPIQNWLRNKDIIAYLGLWESINNKYFKRFEFEAFKNEAGSNKFTLSAKKWINGVNAIGIISKSGKYGGTYAHSDIAFEFASWLSPEFKLYMIKEFERLKKKETQQEKLEWNVNRILTKINYAVHTDAIKRYIVPTLTEQQIKFIYKDEADVLNVALFGMTAKEWKKNNRELSKSGNMRDYADLIHLIILNNLENINFELIKMGIKQSDRLIKLNETARNQISIFENNRNIKELETLSKQLDRVK